MTWRRRYTHMLPTLGISMPFAVWGIYASLRELAHGDWSVVGAISLAVCAGCVYLNLALYANARAHGWWEDVDMRVCECGHPVQLHKYPADAPACFLAQVPDEIVARVGVTSCNCQAFVARPVWWRRVLRRVTPA